jgi:hypothetical protein
VLREQVREELVGSRLPDELRVMRAEEGSVRYLSLRGFCLARTASLAVVMVGG